jgi:hypothetical protein
MTRMQKIAKSLVAENEEYIQQAIECVSTLMPAVAKAYRQMFGEESPRTTMDVRVGVSDSDLPEDKVGSFQLPDGECDYGVLMVRPGSFNGERAHYWWVIAHELIHAFLGKNSEYHNEKFNMMADALGMPEQYRK